MAFFGDNACRAWVKGDMGGNIQNSFGVSSIADEGTGKMQVNMSTNNGNNNYCAVTGYHQNGNTNPSRVTYIDDGEYFNDNFHIRVNSATGGINDPSGMFAIVMDTD
jgi:hypothetical protein|tara:strand:- start:962 stop:1282 length:321 start_codon:yes stop_codon:yes gene_type:complete